MSIDRTDNVTRKNRLDHACEELYQQHRSRLVHYAHLRGCDEHEARDLVQDVFLRLFRLNRLVSLAARPPEVQAGLLNRTLRWLILNRLRQRMTSRRGLGRTPESLDVLLEEGLDLACPGDPATDYDLAWAQAALDRSLIRLRSSMKPAVWQSMETTLSGHTSPVHASTPAMRVALHRARMRLREIVTHEAGAGADVHMGKTVLFQALGRQN